MLFRFTVCIKCMRPFIPVLRPSIPDLRHSIPVLRPSIPVLRPSIPVLRTSNLRLSSPIHSHTSSPIHSWQEREVYHVEGKLVASKHHLHSHMKEMQILACSSLILRMPALALPVIPSLQLLCRAGSCLYNLKDDDFFSALRRTPVRRTTQLLRWGNCVSPLQIKILNPLLVVAGDEETMAELDKEALSISR